MPQKRLRLTITHWTDKYLYAYTADSPDKELCISYTEHPVWKELPSLLYPEAQLNLLSVRTDELTGILFPELFILEPDYLIDISSLAECVQNYGDHPLNYFLNKFKPRENSHHILLGNAANQFLDDCVNEQSDNPATYNRSMQSVFRSDLLAYSACEGIDRDYFDSALKQFNAIRQTVQAVFQSPAFQIEKSGALLEPSFLCECLGLQGRMDFLQGDYKKLIELKSGKADGSGRNLYPRPNHALQMALYKEVLYYNLDIPREEVSSYLFYSQYPKLFAGHTDPQLIRQAMQLRNRIVAYERTLATDGGRSMFRSLTPDMLNLRHISGSLWQKWQRPRIEQILTPIQKVDELTADYFHTFTAFVAREQMMAKIGQHHSPGEYGFAATWRSSTAEKAEAGNILTDLMISGFTVNGGIEKVTFTTATDNDYFLPNFRKGDIVLLYRRNTESDKATNQQVIRGSIEEIRNGTLTVCLRYKQRNHHIFDRQCHYAIEHDFMDSSFSALYKGLYALLTAPTHRRELLLTRRKPEADTQATLTGRYLNPEIDNIVLQAKQAKECFLLVGPPGTGKTSVALRSMVQEFHATPSCNLLLLAYTNRAVDEICDMLESITPCSPPYLRIGSNLSCEPRFHHRLTEQVMASCRQRSEVCQMLHDIRIVVGTVASLNGKEELFQLKHFDVAIIDEASQILEPQIMGILCAKHHDQCAIDRFILIGDHKQLPAVVVQPPELSAVCNKQLAAIGVTDCRNSLFERLYTRLADSPFCACLSRQGRMHPDVSSFVNRFFYNNRLDIVPVAHQEAPLEWETYNHHDEHETLVATTRMAFIDTPPPPANKPDKINSHEAGNVANIVAAIYRLCEQNGLPFQAARRIGIIVPFRNQITMIATRLAALGIPEAEEITIDTVERYQGSQREIILYSTTISRNYQLDILSVPTQADGQLIDRKLNVALTRARKQLFIIGNAALLNQNTIYRQLIDSLRTFPTPYHKR